MKRTIMFLAIAGLLASCSSDLRITINGREYNQTQLESRGVDSVLVAHDSRFSSDCNGVVRGLFGATLIVFKKDTAVNGTIRYYAIR